MTKSDFIEFASIRDIEGVVIAVLTFKLKPNGDKMLSYSFLREFDDGGTLRRTPWLNGRHLSAVERLLPKVKERLREEERKLKEGKG